MNDRLVGISPTAPLWIAALGCLGLALLSLGLSVGSDQLVNGPVLETLADAGEVANADGATGWVTFTPDALDNSTVRILWGLSKAVTFVLLSGSLFLLIAIVESGEIFSAKSTSWIRAGAPILGSGLVANFLLQNLLASRIGSEFALSVSASRSFVEPWMVVLLVVAGALALWERGATLQGLADGTI